MNVSSRMNVARAPWTLYSLVIATILMMTLPALANVGDPEPEVPVADIDIQSGFIVWNPLVPDAIGLTVSGPDGVESYSFDAGVAPFFDIVDSEGNPRPDGNYTFVLTANPDFTGPGFGDSFNGREWELEPSEEFQEVVQSGSFSICEGAFADPLLEEEGSSAEAPVHANKDQVILDDLIVDGSACIGFDCVNGETFGFDTIRLKENNLRIRFDDTSTAASYPNTDWQLVANDSANGGANRFAIDDITNARTPFSIEAKAPSNSLYVDDGGRVGFGTATPVTDLHARDGNSPTLRLEQDGTSGFQPRVWDIVGNEANFFIRDAQENTLPFRIRPEAPDNSIVIDKLGRVGMGTSSPSSTLHVKKVDGTARVAVEEEKDSNGTYTLLDLRTSGGTGLNIRPRFTITHGGNSASWNFDVLNDGNFAFIRNQGSVFTFTSGGNLQIQGDFITQGDFISGGTTLNVPDYVFAEDYYLMPLEEVQAFIDDKSHLPHVPSAAEITSGTFNLTEMQLTLLRKVEELTLYTLEQHETNEAQQQLIQDQQEVIDQLTQRLNQVEGAL